MGAVLGLHIQKVLAIECGLPLGDGVERIARKHGTECGLARTVRAHDGMYLTIVDREVDALQYFLACNGGM